MQSIKLENLVRQTSPSLREYWDQARFSSWEFWSVPSYTWVVFAVVWSLIYLIFKKLGKKGFISPASWAFQSAVLASSITGMAFCVWIGILAQKDPVFRGGYALASIFTLVGLLLTCGGYCLAIRGRMNLVEFPELFEIPFGVTDFQKEVNVKFRRRYGWLCKLMFLPILGLVAFWIHSQQSRHVTLVVDTSGSMSGSLAQIRQVLSVTVPVLGKGSTVSLATVDATSLNSGKNIQEIFKQEQPEQLVGKIRDVLPYEAQTQVAGLRENSFGSPMGELVWKTKLVKKRQGNRGVLVVVSDGDDEFEYLQRDELGKAVLDEQGKPVLVGYNSMRDTFDQSYFFKCRQGGQGALFEAVQLGGGWRAKIISVSSLRQELLSIIGASTVDPVLLFIAALIIVIAGFVLNLVGTPRKITLT